MKTDNTRIERENVVFIFISPPFGFIGILQFNSLDMEGRWTISY